MTESDLPKHECSLTICHNDNRDYYRTVAEELECYFKDDKCFYDWESPEDRQKCIDENNIWTMQWYPNTPIGFNAVAASSLEKLLALAKKVENE